MMASTYIILYILVGTRVNLLEVTLARRPPDSAYFILKNKQLTRHQRLLSRKSEVQPIRVTPEEKRLIALGAKLRGVSMSALLVQSAVKEARALIEQEIARQAETKKLFGGLVAPLSSDEEKLKFIAEGWGVSVGDLKKQRRQQAPDATGSKAMLDDLYAWSRSFAADLEQQFGSIPTDDSELAAYIDRVKSARS
jgi:uncharacterized protein (DUF1778 family)